MIIITIRLVILGPDVIAQTKMEVVLNTLHCLWKTFKITLFICYLKILPLFPNKYESVKKEMHQVSQMYKTPISADEWVPTMATTKYLKYQISKIWDVGMAEKNPVEVGEEAKDVPLFNLETMDTCKLLDFQNRLRPLVVNFGSCS